MAESKGVWFDHKTQKVVSSPPESGVQLVAPGVEPTPDELATVERYKQAGVSEKKADAPAADKTVTTKAASK
jgi:hypothetical protein